MVVPEDGLVPTASECNNRSLVVCSRDLSVIAIRRFNFKAILLYNICDLILSISTYIPDKLSPHRLSLTIGSLHFATTYSTKAYIFNLRTKLNIITVNLLKRFKIQIML